MKKEDIIERMEKLIKIELPKKDKESLFELLVKFQGEEMNISDSQLEILRSYYINTIVEEGDRIQGKIEVENIEKLVSFVSYSNPVDEVIDESTLLKSLRVFTSVKEVYLIYTEETEKNYLALKEEIENKKIEVCGIKVSVDKIENVYPELKNLSISDKISPENTVVDITTGPKIVSISFYKLAVERGIKAINWKTMEIPKYRLLNDEVVLEKGSKRFPFGSSLEVMIEPKNENYKTYEQINESINLYNFQATSMLYSQLGDENMSRFYRELSSFYSFSTLYTDDIEDLKEKLISLLKNINKRVTPTLGVIEKTNLFLTNLIFIASDIYDEKRRNIDEESWGVELIRKFKIDPNNYIVGFDGEVENILCYLISQYLIVTTGEKSTNLINGLFDLDMLDAVNSDEDIYLEFNPDCEGDLKELNKFIPKTSLKERLAKSFSFKDGILEIDRYGFSVDLKNKRRENKTFKKLLENSVEGRVLRSVLENEGHQIQGNNLIQLLINDLDFYEVSDNQLNSATKNLSCINKLRKSLNEEFEILSSNLKDFILHSKDLKKVEISKNAPKDNFKKLEPHIFFINPKYLDI